MQAVIPRIHREAPGLDTIFRTGDFRIYPGAHGKGFLAAVDFWCQTANVKRVYVCPSNYEHWGAADPAIRGTAWTGSAAKPSGLSAPAPSAAPRRPTGSLEPLVSHGGRKGPGNIGVLDTERLEWQWIKDAR